MNLKETFANIYGEYQAKQDSHHLHRKNRRVTKNKGKEKFMEENDRFAKNNLCMNTPQVQLNLLAIKYLESHRPSIKERVVKIYSSHRSNNEHLTSFSYFVKNEELKCRSISIRKQNNEPLLYNP